MRVVARPAKRGIFLLRAAPFGHQHVGDRCAGADDVVGREAIDALNEPAGARLRSEEHTSELQSLMRISYAVFCLKKKKRIQTTRRTAPLRRARIHTHTTMSQQLTTEHTL